MTQSPTTDTSVVTVEAHLVGEGGVRLSEKRALRTISIHEARVLTRFLHEECNYADADQMLAEDFGRLTFGELNFANLDEGNRDGLDDAICWILDDLLKLLMDDGWDITDSTLQLTIH